MKHLLLFITLLFITTTATAQTYDEIAATHPDAQALCPIESDVTVVERPHSMAKVMLRLSTDDVILGFEQNGPWWKVATREQGYAGYAKATMLEPCGAAPALEEWHLAERTVAAPAAQLASALPRSSPEQSGTEEEDDSWSDFFITVRGSTPLRSAPLAVGDEVDRIPTDGQAVAKGHENGYWVVVYNGRLGYVADAHVEQSEAVKRYKTSSAYAPTRAFRAAPDGRTLFVGPRGGCYYFSDSGGKVYVDRSECAGITRSAPARSSSSSYSSGSSGGSVHVRGHYRTTKSGKRVYVKPHTRSRPRRH